MVALGAVRGKRHDEKCKATQNVEEASVTMCQESS